MDEPLGSPEVVMVKLWWVPTAKVVVIALVIAGDMPMTIENVWVTLAPTLSMTVTDPDENVPTAVGVPVKLMVLPNSVALSPVGRPLEDSRE
jgi:hypothetical protein